MKVTRLVPLEETGPGDLAHGLLDAVIEDFRQPRARVEFAASFIVAMCCARAGARFIPTMVAAIAMGKAAGWVYESAEEIKSKLDRADAPRGV